MSGKQLKKLDAGQIVKLIASIEKAQTYLAEEETHRGSAHMKVGYATGTFQQLLKQLKGEWPL